MNRFRKTWVLRRGEKRTETQYLSPYTPPLLLGGKGRRKNEFHRYQRPRRERSKDREEKRSVGPATTSPSLIFEGKEKQRQAPPGHPELTAREKLEGTLERRKGEKVVVGVVFSLHLNQMEKKRSDYLCQSLAQERRERRRRKEKKRKKRGTSAVFLCSCYSSHKGEKRRRLPWCFPTLPVEKKK